MIRVAAYYASQVLIFKPKLEVTAFASLKATSPRLQPGYRISTDGAATATTASADCRRLRTNIHCNLNWRCGGERVDVASTYINSTHRVMRHAMSQRRGLLLSTYYE